jgi:hypothetical protein
MKKDWSCSKFADWLRGTPKLSSGTSEEWRAWKKQAKTKKFRYWLAEEGLDYAEGFILWPFNRIDDIRCYIKNRWVSKSHALTSNLKRGNWYDLDTRLLHAVFDELVNFVEIEQAWKLIICSEEDHKKYQVPWYHNIFHIGEWRSAEAGLAHLKWAADLKNDDDWIDKNDPTYGQPTQQALAALEILKLYHWWKEERPNRPDPRDISGWNKYYEEKRAAHADDDSWLDFITDKKSDDGSGEIFKRFRLIEQQQEDEDTAMLIRLINIRMYLWA